MAGQDSKPRPARRREDAGSHADPDAAERSADALRQGRELGLPGEKVESGEPDSPV
jgi:hypothetical protein